MAKLPQTFPSLEISDVKDTARLRAVFTAITQMFQRVSAAFNNPEFGATAARPSTQLTVGQSYFDTTLGQPIWVSGDGVTWVDATGAPV